jgi:Tol biopolymer transport system component
MTGGGRVHTVAAMTNPSFHIRRGLLLAPLIALAAAPAAFATTPGQNGRIAFYSDTGSGPQIYSVRKNGADLRQLTHVTGADAKFPDYSPDGKLIAFGIEAEDDAHVGIMNADGGGLRVLPHPPGVFDSDPSFTPDGRRVIIDRFDGTTEFAVSSKLDGSHQHVLVSPAGPDPNLSPDGGALSFLGFNDGEEPAALMTASFPGNQVRQLTPFSFDVGFKSDWAPDGDRIAITHNANFFLEGQSANIATMRPDGSDLRFVTHYAGGEVNAFFGSYSPDGKSLVFRLEDHGRFGLYKIHPDGTHLRAIMPLSDFAPRFIDWGPRPGDHRDHRDQGDRD